MPTVSTKRKSSPAFARTSLGERGKLVDDIYDAQAGLCFHCLRLMDPWTWSKRHPNGFTRDHVAPKSKGRDGSRNTVLAHQWCNVRRGNAFLSEVDAMRARLVIAAVLAKRGGW